MELILVCNRLWGRTRSRRQAIRKGERVPDSTYRWIVVGYTLVIQAVSLGVLLYSFALFAVPWLDFFAAPRRDVMLMASLLQFGVGIFSPLVGRLMDRYPMRWIVFIGLALMLVGLLLGAGVESLWQLQLLFATVFPLSMAFMGTLASQTLITRWFAEQRGLAIGISAMGTNLGGIVFPLLVAWWLALYGWRDTLVWLAAVSLLLVGPLTWLVLRRHPPELDPEDVDNHFDNRLWTTREILSTARFWLPVLCMLPMMLAFGAVQFNIGAYAGDLGFGTDVAARLVAVSSVCMVVGKFFFGGLGDRLDHRLLYWLSLAFMASAMLILQTEASLWVLTLGVVCVGLSGGGLLPLLGLIFGSRFGVASFGRVMGLVMLSLTAGSAGPLLAGWVYDFTGGYDLVFLLFLALFLPAGVAMRWLRPPEV
jgi:MFS family permease